MMCALGVNSALDSRLNVIARSISKQITKMVVLMGGYRVLKRQRVRESSVRVSVMFLLRPIRGSGR